MDYDKLVSKMLSFYVDEQLSLGVLPSRQPEFSWLVEQGYEEKLKKREEFDEIWKNNPSSLLLAYIKDEKGGIKLAKFMDPVKIEYVYTSWKTDLDYDGYISPIKRQLEWMFEYVEREGKEPSYEGYIEAVRNLGMWSTFI